MRQVERKKLLATFIWAGIVRDEGSTSGGSWGVMKCSDEIRQTKILIEQRVSVREKCS